MGAQDASEREQKSGCCVVEVRVGKGSRSGKDIRIPCCGSSSGETSQGEPPKPDVGDAPCCGSPDD